MTTPRNLDAELDAVKEQLEELKRLITGRLGPAGEGVGTKAAGDSEPGTGPASSEAQSSADFAGPAAAAPADLHGSGIYYAGQIAEGPNRYRLEPRMRRTAEIMEADGEKAGRVLAAIGHKQRLDILRSVLREPLTGSELVERLSMGTTGQLYHHIKALMAADLLVQEERGGRYSVPAHRILPLMLLLAAATDLLDASDYLDMEEARSQAGLYLGEPAGGFDPHYLLRALMENAVLEHREGTCSEVQIVLNEDGSLTVADNGRGIPTGELAPTERSRIQEVLTDMKRLNGAVYQAPGAGKGIHIAVVNALSSRLSVEVRRKGRIYRQDYRFGIPQTGLLTVGATKETGTSITLVPDPGLFPGGFDPEVIRRYAEETAQAWPGLLVQVL